MPKFAALSDSGTRRLIQAYYDDPNGAVAKDFSFKPGFTYSTVRAISARVNQNYDAWPSEELKKSYRTFIGKPCFVNHNNSDPSKARGVVVAARYVESGNDKYIETIMETDSQRFPKLAHEIKTGGMDSVSMGVEAGFTKCSICDNKATDLHDMCGHVKHSKGKYLPHVKTGKKTLCYENCFVPGTRITMADGTTKLIEDVSVDDMVLDHLGSPRRVTQTMSRLISGEVVSLVTHANHSLSPTMTGNHPVLAIRANNFGQDTKSRMSRLDRGLRPEFIEARDLQEGDWVCRPRQTPYESLPKIRTIDYVGLAGDTENVVGLSSLDTSQDELFYPAGLYHGRWKHRQRHPWILRPCHNPSCDEVMELRPSDCNRMFHSAKCWGEMQQGKNVGNRYGNLDRHPFPESLDLNEEFGKFVGWFLSEGSTDSDNSQVDFALHRDEEEQAQSIIDLASSVFGLTSSTNKVRGNGRVVTIHSAKLARLMNNFGQGAANKALPDEFMSAPVEFIRGVIIGHELGDGLHVQKSVEKHGHKHFTCSPKLAEQIYTIHIMLGNTPYHSVRSYHGHEYPGKNASVWKDLHVVGHGSTSRLRGQLNYGPWTFTRIRKLSKEPYSGAVHNLEVADTHTYVADGISTHNCYKLSFFELSYVFDPADETAVVSKVLVASKGSDAMYRRAYGETAAPPNVNTLRNNDDSDNDHFHHYVESPKELQDPDLEGAGGLHREEEGGRRAGDVADIDTADDKKRIVEPDQAHEEVIDDFLDWCDSINVEPGEDSLNDFSNSYHLNDEDYQAISDFLAAEQGNGAGPTNANQPVPHTSRRKRMATYRYAEEELQGPEGYDGDGDADDFEPGAPPHDHDGDGDIDYEGEQEGGGSPEELIEEFVSWCEEVGAEPGQEALDAFDQEAQLDDEEYQLLAEIVGGGGEEEQQMPPQGDPGMDPAMMGGAPEMDPAMMQQMQMQARRRQASDDENINETNAYERPNGEQYGDDRWENDYGKNRKRKSSNGNRNTSSLNERRAKKGKSMARQTLASRGQDVATRQRLHRFADDNGHFDSGPYDENNQGEQEDIYLSQTPGSEGVSAPVPGDGTISNTERNLVARIEAQKNSLQRDIVAWNSIQQRKYAADGGLPDADTVNPELSGTDEQSLKGQDFERVQPDKVPTQPKDASLKAFAAFDSWLRDTTGRTAAQHGNANFIRRQAARWAGAGGYPVEVLFPALGNFLRQARRIEGSANMRRTADEKLEVAAPQDRIDVEAPVSNTTDADAQASQFDLGDFGHNAGDGIADPDLGTGSQIWAPGEGVKESNRKADGVAAIRLAEAYIKAGLKPEGEKYNLVAQFQTMRHATVTDRTRLLEAVLKTATFSRRVTAGSINRGTAPRSPFPPGLMNGGGMSRSASVNRVAANDPSTDSDLFL